MSLTSLAAGGYMGKILRVDLTRQRITVETPDEETLRKYIGGTGLGAKLLYYEVPPGVEWNDPENRLILASGPLGGAKVAGSGTFSVVTKGPLTNGATSTQANGYFGAYLKFSGFDAIVVQGMANKWAYLYVHDGIAELRDASHLMGRDTWETEELIKAELGKSQREASVFCVGPAGEKLVKFAAIVGDKGHVAAHNGVGAVMGSKLLKAVVATRGMAKVVIRDGRRLSDLNKEMIENAKKDKRAQLYWWGTSMLFPRQAIGGQLPVKNMTTNLFPEYGKFAGEYYRSRFKMQPHPCWACPMHHCHIIEVTEGPYAGYIAEEPEYEGWAAWSSLIGQADLGAAVMLNDVTDRLGMDVNEASWLIAFVMECYEKGLISRKDTSGIEPSWGNVEAVRALLHHIAQREGIGDVLAEGVMRAAQYIGGEAVNMAVFFAKGHSPRGGDFRARWSEILDCSISNTGTIETGPTVSTLDLFSPEAISISCARAKGGRPFVDSLVLCAFPCNMNVMADISPLVPMLNAATGWSFTTVDALEVGVRIVNLLRAFNIRHGITPEMEAPSPRLCSTPVDGPAKGKSIVPYWEDMLNNYYRLMGWDRKSGRPLQETLRGLGLSDIVPDIWGQSEAC